MAKVSLRAYNREIETMLERGQLDEAVAHCHHILRTFPKHLETYRLLGKVYLELKRYPDAVDIFSRALVAEPNDFVSHVGMSIIRDEENKLDDAIWHMERAFETQPSNAAIQAELQRLYGRRDGVQPSRIRMTRGALAHMYVQGELYPQAIAETKGILEEDPGRTDMQALLARAYYRSGQKKDAADIATALLKRYPYCFDANRVLVEIIGSDRPESAQVYRHRVVELDPYAAQVNDTVFQSSEVSDAAVTLERLDWNGQPSGMQTDWGATQAISLESGKARDEQPDWLRGARSLEDTAPPVGLTPGTPAPAFDDSAPTEETQATQPADDIPEFLRAAGWGKSTGAFDESKSMFADEPELAPPESIEQGDLPDWVKAMAPPEVAQPPAEAEELPDWISKIGSGALASQATSDLGGEPDWLGQLEQTSPSQAQPMEGEPDWLGQLEQPSQPQAQPTEEEPDWLGQLEQPSQPQAQPTEGEPDWLKQFDQAVEQPAPADASVETPDWLKDFAQPVSPSSTDEQPDWLKSIESESVPEPAQTIGQPDWLGSLESEPEPAQTTEQPDWLGSLESEPEPAPSVEPAGELEVSDQPTEELEQPEIPAKVDTGSLGTSEQERDDSFAWLEALAAKQGASEGLLTRPEERLEEEPDWVKQVKGLDVEAVESTPPAAQPPASIEELGKSEQERDDSFAWLESLAAKQGASEGLLTKPEERLEEEPEWVRQAKSLSTSPLQPPVSVFEEPVQEKPVSAEEPTPWLHDLEEQKAEPVPEMDATEAWLDGLKETETAPEEPAQETFEPVTDTAAWLRSLDEDEAGVEPAKDETGIWLKSLDETAAITEEPVQEEAEPVVPDTAEWLKTLDEPESAPSEPQPEPVEEIPAWMQELMEEKAPAVEPTLPAEEAAQSSDWVSAAEEPISPQVTESEATVDLPDWLSGLDKEQETASVPAASDELPAWLRDETGETVAEPPKIEPIRTGDWQPLEEIQPEVLEPVAEETQPETAPPSPEPVMQQPEPEPKPAPKAKKPERKKTKPLPPPPEVYKEPLTIKGTGMLTMPVDPILESARTELTRSNIPGALETYGKLIKKGRFLDEVIYDLREALYRYPVEVSIWQALGDAYMRGNRLQDALDAYTKAEELLR
jgi:tetratricopeptide (TPR) repeat protein